MMVTSKGSRSYIVQYQIGGRGFPSRRYTIGKHGSPWTADRARQRAADLLELIRKGIDPLEEERRARTSAAIVKSDEDRLAFDAYVDLFGRKYIDAKGLRSGNDIKAVLQRDLVPAFSTTPISQIRRAEITTCLDSIADRSMSASIKAHKWLRKVFLWAVDRGDLTTSPMNGMPPPGVDGQRTRVLKGRELRAVWCAAEAMSEPYASFFKALLLTGQRLREVAGMTWDEIDLAKREWVIPAARTKNARDHLVPLSPTMTEILSTRSPNDELRRGPIFSTDGTKPINGFSKAKARLDAQITRYCETTTGLSESTVGPWVLHDLRRSFSTGCQSLGFPIEHTEAALNHVSGKRGGLVGVYQLWEYAPEKVVLMAAWSRHVEATVHATDANVVPLLASRA